MTETLRAPFQLGDLPAHARMVTIDARRVAAPVERIFPLARDVEDWPHHLAHYRRVHFDVRATDGGGVVAMSANRPFGVVQWPTWWTSEMSVGDPQTGAPWIRFRHIRGITTGMEVLWRFEPQGRATDVTIVHMWNGPAWPLIGVMAARAVIGPVFVHGIASRTLEGLARVAEASDVRSPERGA